MLRSMRKGFCIGLAVVVLLLQACVTPSEIKSASQKQLEFIDSLDNAVSELQSAVDQFHRDQASLIRVEGRMQIARAAVLLATDESADVSADGLFAIFEKEVHPWVQGAFSRLSIDARIAALEARIQRETNFAIKAQLNIELNELKEAKARQSTEPQAVAQIEQTVQVQLDDETTTAASVRKNLEFLRAQIALMKMIQSRVDAWLSIDISPSQKQVDSLTKSIVEARNALSGDGS